MAGLTINRIDSNTGQVVRSFSSPGSRPIGLAWDGTHLWHSDENGIHPKLSQATARKAGNAWQTFAQRATLAWTEAHPSTVPPARTDHKLVFDGQRGEVVLFGGLAFSGPSEDTGKFDEIDSGSALNFQFSRTDYPLGNEAH
ncbi:MAG TPA: hypothetical protein EYP04_04695 [Anaerolineae bacterium]|nr:hypothetical protein [Anaerolineae bacterium]HIQ05904.1 hypothetical protein [Anaerolineae bacterium]